jgi:hypothetical protein
MTLYIALVLSFLISWSDINKSSDRFHSTTSPSVHAENSNPNDLFASLSYAFEGVIKKPALLQALEGLERFQGSVREDRLIIIDFSLPSTQERFFLINPQTGELLYKKLVAHGQGTGELYAEHFSNKSNSHQSSLGYFKTAETYHGKHGLSVRLDGLQKGLNDAARERAVVIHAADYVSHAFIESQGRLGRSWGCPALPADDYTSIVNEVANGTLMFIYHPSLSKQSGLL